MSFSKIIPHNAIACAIYQTVGALKHLFILFSKIATEYSNEFCK